MKVFISRKIQGDIEQRLRKEGHTVSVWQENRPPTAQELIHHCKDVHGLVCMLSDEINQSLIEACPNLRVIANYAVGYNNIDLSFASSKNISVGNTPDVLTDATADLALTLTMSLSRHIISANKQAAAGLWKGFSPRDFLGQNLRDKVVGIIGAGRIGSRYATTMHRAFNTKTLYYSRSPKTQLEQVISATKVPLEELLKSSDIISLHLPSTSTTQNLLDQYELSLLKPSAILINTARGDIINQEALVSVLKQKKIFGAALDVMTPEPLPKEHELFKLENCLITPHIGSATMQARTSMSEICFLNIMAGLKGEKLPYKV